MQKRWEFRSGGWLLMIGLLAGCAHQNDSPAATPSAPVPSAPVAETPRRDSTSQEACLRAARACANHMVTADIEALVDCMPERVVEGLAGREVLVREARKSTDEMSSRGSHIESAVIEPPSQLVGQGKETFAVVPQLVTVRVNGARVRQKSYLLGISEDGGRSWKFLDGAGVQRELVKRFYPDFPESIELPELGPPEIEQRE